MIDPTSVAIGDCKGCNDTVYGGEATVDKEGHLWHPECRQKALAKPSRGAKS